MSGRGPGPETSAGSAHEGRAAEPRAAPGLRLTPAERLRWLEETMAVLRRWCGRARGAPTVGARGDDAGR